MNIFTRLTQASDLVSGMKQRLGIAPKITGTAEAEWATQSFRTMVLRCASCDGQEACTRLQAENTTLDAPPSYCRNAQEFTA